MARQSKETLIEQAAVIEWMDEQERIESRLQEVRASVTGGDSLTFRATIYKIEANKDKTLCLKCDWDDLDTNQLAAEFGGGRFRIFLMPVGLPHGAQTGKDRIAPESFELQLAERKSKEPVPVAKVENTDRIEFQMMREQNAANQQMILKLIEGLSTHRPATDAMGGLDVLKLLDHLKASAPDQTAMVKLFAEGIALGRSVEPPAVAPTTGAGDNDVLVEALRSVFPALASIAGKGNTPAPAEPLAGLPAPPPPVPENANGDDMKYKWFLGVLVNAAKHNTDPADFVGMIFSAMSELEVDAFISRPDALQLMAAIEPRVLMYSPWFEKLKALIADEFEPGSNENHPLPAA